MKKTIKYLQDGEYHYATVKDVGDLEQLKTKHKEDLVTALNELFTTGGDATPTGYDDLVKKVNDTQTTVDGINSTITDVNGKVVANDEAIAQAKKDLQDALAQFQEFNDEIEQAKKDAETELSNAKQALKDDFADNLADAQKANQKQLEDKVAAVQGNLDTTSNTLNDVKTQLTNAKLDYGNVNTSIQKLNDMLATKLSSTDLDPLKTSIQNQETEIQQTKDSIATKAGKAEFDVLSGRVSTAESKIKQQADEIGLGVKKSELNGAIDNYQVEGTNRLRDTIDFDIDNGYWKLDQYSINSNTDVHPYDQAHDVSALVLQKTGSAKQDVDFTNEDLGNSFVISVWNKKDAQPQVWYGNTQLTNRQVSDIKGDYERSFFTFIPTDVNVKTIMFKYDAGTVDQLVIGEPKLELGTKPKAYAPNPNDEHKQIVNTKAELKIASDKIESTVEKQTKTDNNINQLSSRVTQTEQGITATNDLITKTKDGLIKDYTGKIDASAKSLSSEFDEKTDEKIGQITDSGENLILNSAFTNETDRKDKWQNISDKVNIVDDGNGLMWAKMSQSGLTADNPISLTSNYFPIKQGKITVGVDIKSDNTDGLSGAKILVLQTYNANKQRVDFTELTLENMGLTVQQLADGQSHRGVYRLGNDRSDAVYMTVKAVLPRNGLIYFTNFSAKLSSIDNGGYTPNAEDLKRQILNQKTKIEQNSQQITLKASSTELRDVRTIANGAVSSAANANNNASSAVNTANTANTNATNAASVANNANNKANSATTVANQANSNANQAVTTANIAKSKINDIQTQIDQARTDIQSTLTVANNGVTAATNLKTTYDNYVQKNDANIKLLGDRITNEVSKITSNGGGRNLWIGSQNLEHVSNDGNATTFSKDGSCMVAHIPAECGFYSDWAQIYANNTDPFAIGDSETFSLEMKGTGSVTINRQDNFEKTVTLTDQWKRYSVSGTVTKLNSAHTIWSHNANDDIYVRLPMVEKGVIAHEWQPAPEDTNSQIEAVSSKIDQTATSITSTVNSTKQDLQGQINSTNTKITQTANSITEQLKSYSKTGDMQNYVNTTVKKTADGINAKVSGVESRVNGLKIGGRNYLRDSDKSISGWAQDLGTMPNEVLNSLAGETITVSVDTEWSDYQHSDSNQNRLGFELSVSCSDGKSYWLGAWKSPTTPSGKERMSTTYTLPANVTFTVGNNGQNGYVSINGTGKVSHAQVEIGNVAKDWQPAPEDTNSAIQATKADLVQQITDAKNAAIKVSKDSIASEVSDVRTTITQVDNKVAAIQANGGGRNLLQGTRDFAGDWFNLGTIFTKTGDTYNGLSVIETNADWNGVGKYYQVKQGETYTFSLFARYTSGTGSSGIYVLLNSNPESGHQQASLDNYMGAYALDANWKKCSITFTATTDGYIKPRMERGVSNTNTLQICGYMLEKGTVAHEWQPAPEDVATDISNVNTKVEQYKTGIDQTATGMNLFAQVITGNNSIDVTKSNIGIDPNQIKIASNKIVIDGDTEFRGNGKWIDGKYINIEKLNHTENDTDYIDQVSFDSGGIRFSEYEWTHGEPRDGSVLRFDNDKLGAVINVDYYQNKKEPGLSIVGNDVGISAEPMRTSISASDPVSHLLLQQGSFGLDAAQASGRGTVVGISGDVTTGNLTLEGNIQLTGSNVTVQHGTAITVQATPTTQDKLMVVAQTNSNSTQYNTAQPTLRAGQSLTNMGDSGLTFYWNSVKAFGTFDLRDTHVLGNRNTHFSVETTFDTDGEANMCFTWTSRSDLWNNSKLPMLARADWWTSQWGSCGLGFANGRLFYFTNDGYTYKQLN